MKDLRTPSKPSYFFAACLIAALLTLIGALLASRLTGVPAHWLTVDPGAISNVHPLIGALSNLGILLWAATAALCLFTFVLLQNHGTEAPTRRFLLYFGLVTAVLMVDDLFMVHEELAPRYLRAEETLVVGIHGLLLLGGLVYFGRVILSTPYLYLLTALFFFGGSIAIDMVWSTWAEWPTFFEDGAKFMGIAAWMSYFSTVCYTALAPTPYREKTSREKAAADSSPSVRSTCVKRSL